MIVLDTDLSTTAVTVAEIRCGLARLPAGARRDRLQAAAEDVFAAFPDQVLAFDLSAAAEYAQLVCDRERCGLPIDGVDAQIAAICRTHGAPLATRNVKDFVETGVVVLDPWSAD